MKNYLLSIIILVCNGLYASDDSITNRKETYFPAKVWKIADDNDYSDTASQFCSSRMKESPNIVALWEKQFGADPETCDSIKYRFPLNDLLWEADKMFCFYRDTLKFVDKGSSVTDKYRMMMYFFYSDEGTVYGGSAESDKIGVVWITPNRVKKPPYGAIAHELGHAFQSIVKYDHGRNFPGGSIYEMTSQYMLWQYYPEWISFENYHLVDFLKQTHLAFLHQSNMYHSPFVLEYWASLHGRDFIGKMWKNVNEGEDPVMTYKRLAHKNQKQFCDELAMGYLKFMTWDIDRVREVSKAYINMHSTKMEKTGDGWLRIAKANCPQDYGYNGIKLNVPDAGTKIKVQFKGIAGAEQVANAGWRCGFVALKGNGERVYSNIFSEKGKITFTVPQNTVNLWLVVMGAPKEHHTLKKDNEYPYQIKVTGADVVE